MSQAFEKTHQNLEVNQEEQTVLESTRSPDSLEQQFQFQGKQTLEKVSQEALSGQVKPQEKSKQQKSIPQNLPQLSQDTEFRLQADTILPGRYRVKQALGKGGYGSVYAGKDLSLDRAIAIKLLSHELEGQAAQRFKDEGRLIAKLQHPHIIQVYAFNEHDFHCPFLVMEHFGTGSLKDHWQKDEPAPLYESCIIIAQVLDALHAAHQVGVVHRDIKEANILYDHQNQTIKLCDFGIARAVERLEDQAQTTKEGCVIGTGHYIAPERYKGINHDPRSDLYSVGVLFHRLLTGHRPHESYYGEPLAPGIVMYRSSYEGIEHIKGIPRAIERICLRLLERDIDLRYQSAKQAQLDLLEALQSPETKSYEHELNMSTHAGQKSQKNASEPDTWKAQVSSSSSLSSTQTLGIFYRWTAILKRSSAVWAFLLGMILFGLFWLFTFLSQPQVPTIIKLGAHSIDKVQSEKTQQGASSTIKPHTKDNKPVQTKNKVKAKQSFQTTASQKQQNKIRPHSKTRKSRSKSRSKAQPKNTLNTGKNSPYVFPVRSADEASP